jgi:hypothetical protein
MTRHAGGSVPFQIIVSNRQNEVTMRYETGKYGKCNVYVRLVVDFVCYFRLNLLLICSFARRCKDIQEERLTNVPMKMDAFSDV